MDKVQLLIELDWKDYEELNTFYILNLGTAEYRKIIEKHCIDAIRHGKPYEPGAASSQEDLISRVALKDEVRKHAEYYADRTREDRYNVGYTECACEVLDFIDNAQIVELFTQLEKKEIADAIKYLLGAELLEENGYTEEVKNALRSALKKVGGQEE